MKAILRKFLRAFRYDFVRYIPAYHATAALMLFFRQRRIDLVLDVGANTGQFAKELRRNGYRGKIISFEPLSSAFRILKERAGTNAGWDAVNVALGNESGESKINIAGNSVSSSLFDMLPRHSQSAPGSDYIGTETIKVARLDDIFNVHRGTHKNIYLKIDTQGFEKNVLDGAAESLKNIVGVQLELSLVTLYEGAPTIEEMLEYMRLRSFQLFSIEPGFRDPATGQLLQVDAVFFRELNVVATMP